MKEHNEEERLHLEHEEQKLKMEYDLKALLIQCRNQTVQNNIFFGIAAATKLLPTLASDQEPEVYLIT